MKEKLYNFWSENNDHKEQLLEDINNNLNEGVDGATILLDWCSMEYDTIREQYGNRHNLNENEVMKIVEKHFGEYKFLCEDDNDIDLYNYAMDLDDIWDLSNWYLDYVNKDMTEEELLDLIG